MISEWFLDTSASFTEWLADLFGEWTPPEFMSDPQGVLGSLLAMFVGLGGWVDWTVLGVCLTAVIAAFVVGFTIKLVRAVVAHVPLFGGAG